MADDGVADFLAREKDELAGIDGDLTSPISEGPDPPGMTDDDEDLENGNEINFESGSAIPIPAMSDLTVVLGGPPTDVEVEPVVAQPIPVAVPTPQQNGIVGKGKDEKKVPHKIIKWREDFQARVIVKDAAEAERIEEMKGEAKRELAEFNRHRLEQIEKNKKHNREAEVEFLRLRDEQAVPGKSWEGIAKLCEFKPRPHKHEKDVSRLRTILLHMKTLDKTAQDKHQ